MSKQSAGYMELTQQIKLGESLLPSSSRLLSKSLKI